MQFFDCNVRIGPISSPPPVPPPYECEEVAGQLTEAGISAALVYHSWAQEWSAARGNEKLLEEIADYEHLHPCFVALPAATGEMQPPGELAAMARELRGAVRVYPQLHNFELADWCCQSLLGALADAEVPLIVESAQITWPQLERVLAEYCSLPVIILDAGYRISRRIFALWERHENLYLEHNTYKPFWGIEDVCARFGPQRLIFGTNFPVHTLGSAISPLTYSELSNEDKQLIAGGNLRRLLGWEGR